MLQAFKLGRALMINKWIQNKRTSKLEKKKISISLNNRISQFSRSSMQPRILVREQGQNKKRFISPTEVKNNQAIYGDPLGGSKTPINAQSVGMNSERLYIPDNRRSIIDLQRQESQKNIAVKTQNTQRMNEAERMRSIGQNSKQQAQISTAKSTSKPKLAPQISKKDYMMSTLAKLNRHKTRQSDEQSNGSQSRSKVTAIKNEKHKKETTEQEYTKNVYNQKQKEVKRRPRNTDSHSRTSSVESREGFGIQKSGRYQSHGGSTQTAGENPGTLRVDTEDRRSPETIQTYREGAYMQPPTSPTVRPGVNPGRSVQNNSFQNEMRISQKEKPSKKEKQQKLLLEPNLQPQKPPFQPQFVKRASTQQTQTPQQRPLLSPRDHSSVGQYATSNQEKISLTSVQQSRMHEQGRSQIEESNNSSLVVHLRRAHEQKDQMLQKKIQAEKDRNELKLKLENQQQLLIQLRTQLEHSQVQNLSLNSELKSLRQTQTRTRTQVQDTNQRNEHVYRELHENYQLLVEDYRRAMMENDGLRQECQRFRTEGINYEKRVKFLEARGRQLQVGIQQKEQEHRGEVRKTVEEWRMIVDKLEIEIRKYQQEGDSGSNGTNLGHLKIKLIECETQLNHKASQVKSREDQVNSLKKQIQAKSQQLESILSKKDREINQLARETHAAEQRHTERCGEYEAQVKQLQLKVAAVQKELSLKRLEIQEQKQSSKSRGQSLSGLYSEHGPQSQEAQHSLQAIVSSQTESLNSCRKELNKSISENFALKSDIEELKSLNNNLKQQLGILQMQYGALEKKLIQSRDADMYVIKSQLDTANRRQKELEMKLQAKVKEVREKDDFIQAQFLRGQKN